MDSIEPEEIKIEDLVDGEGVVALTAFDFIHAAMTRYACHTRRNQIPNPIDGLKPVHRRILWALKDYDRLIKMHLVIGRVMQYHPHGDRGIYEALCRMCQSFSYTHELVYGDGNIGSYIGTEPAHSRYLDIKRGEFAMDMYFNGVNLKTLDWVLSEVDAHQDKEPSFFIPVVPMALVTSVFGIAVGFSSNIIPHNFNSICKLTENVILHKMFHKKLISVKPPDPDINWFIPDSLVPSLILNYKQLCSDINMGKYSSVTVYEGTMSITPTAITLHTLPLGVPTDTTYENLVRAVLDKNSKLSAFVQSIDDESSDLLTIRLNLKRGVDPFEVLSIVKTFVKFKSPQHPMMVWADRDGTLEEADVDKIIEMWYTTRFRSMLSDIKHTQADLITELQRIEARCVVVPHTDLVLQLIRSAKNVQEATQQLYETFLNMPDTTPLTLTQAQYIASMTLGNLTRMGLSELLEKRAEIKGRLDKVRDKFASIDTDMIAAIERVNNKYKLPRKARLPKFFGYVQTPTGVIQIWDETELHGLLVVFDNQVKVYYIGKGQSWKYCICNNKLQDESELSFSKEFACSQFIVTKRKPHSTVVLNTESNTIYRLNILNAQNVENETATLVGDNAVVIHKNGLIEIIPTTNIKLYNKRAVRGIATSIVSVHNVESNDMVVVYACPKVKNEIRIARIKSGSKLLKDPRDPVEVLGIFDINDSFVVNIPDHLTRRAPISHVLIKQPNELLADKDNVRLLLTKKQTDTGVNFVKTKHGMLSV